MSVFLLGLQITIQAVIQFYFSHLFNRITDKMITRVDAEINNNFIGQSTAIEQNILQLVLNWDV